MDRLQTSFQDTIVSYSQIYSLFFMRGMIWKMLTETICFETDLLEFMDFFNMLLQMSMSKRKMCLRLFMIRFKKLLKMKNWKESLGIRLIFKVAINVSLQILFSMTRVYLKFQSLKFSALKSWIALLGDKMWMKKLSL